MTRTSFITAAITLALVAVVAALTLGPPVAAEDAVGGDKIQHALGFGSIVLPAALFRPRWLWGLVPAAIAFGGLVELVQPSVGRQADVMDWIADIVGIVTAAALGRATAAAIGHLRPALLDRER